MFRANVQGTEHSSWTAKDMPFIAYGRSKLTEEEAAAGKLGKYSSSGVHGGYG